MSEIYTGPSRGFAELTDGYVDYANHVITSRAVSDVRDGLKPVNRRVLFSMHTIDKGYLQKSPSLIGEATKIHPHGDSSVYGAMVLMTDENGTYNVPPLIGHGSYGKVGSAEPYAHQRYTKVRMHPDAEKDYFSDEEIMDMVLSEEGVLYEPKVLDVLYPTVLINGAEGIAVSAGTKMASFNFKDVLELTLKYLKNGKLTIDDMIYPDFSSGGVMVCNKKEVARIMLVGKGKLKVRAKVNIEGSEIIVVNVPVGKTDGYIVKKIQNADIQGIVKVSTSMSKDPETGYVTITCRSKRVVEEVLMRLYQMNILQSTFASNTLVVNDGKPAIMGVYDIVEVWCKWREARVVKKATNAIESLLRDSKIYSIFVNLIDNKEMKDTFIDIITNKGKAEAIKYLKENLEGCDDEVAKWIVERSVSVFHTGGTYRERYETCMRDVEYWREVKDNPVQYIIKQLEDLLRERGNKYPRKTEISFHDYRFSKVSDADEIEDDSACVYTLKKDGFLLKTRNPVNSPDVLYNINARANSVLIGFDNYGRILRVIGKEIAYTQSDKDGVYLPKYFGMSGMEEEMEKFGYQILYMCVLDGSKKLLVYRDGYIGTFDTSEYMGKKNIKIINQGVCLAVRDKLLEVYEESDIPEYILLADNSGSKVKVGVVATGDIPERGRTSRAKVLSGTDINTEYLKGFKYMDLLKFIGDPTDYLGKCKIFKGTWYGDPSEVMEGSYLDMCKDLNQ